MEVGFFSKYVKELIIDLDQVDIPGFGIFYAENVPATISDRGTTINPPFRRMYFRKQEVTFGEALPYIQYVCAVQGVNPEQAKVETEWCLSRIHSELNGNRSCTLPGLGEMKASSDGEYFFIPDEQLDICPDSFGLEPVCINITQAAAEMPAATPAATPASTPAPTPEQPAPKPAPAPLPPEEETKAAELRQQEEITNEGEPHFAKREKEPRRVRPGIVILLIIIALIGAAVAFYLLFPVEADDLIESILYTPEELELLRR